MRFESLDEWLPWLEQLHPLAVELGLERVIQVASDLTINTSLSQVITVAGTNGKGSTLAALQALLSCPHKTLTHPSIGVYSSPHLKHFTERVQVNGQPIEEAYFCQALERVDQARLRCELTLSYFEFTTLAALLIFSEQGLDYILLEVGLGGRLDAVNIIDADIAVITPIDLDHQAWLGDTREAIAIEKAGILRSGQSSVIADLDPPQSLIKQVKALKVEAVWPKQQNDDGHGFFYSTENSGLSWQGKTEGGKCLLQRLPVPQLAAPSWSAALQVALLLNALPSENICRQLLGSVTLAGRLQRISYANRVILLDVAHNSQSVARLADYLANESTSEGEKSARWIGVFAALDDKDIPQMLDLTASQIRKWYLPVLDNCSRARPPTEIAEYLEKLGTNSPVKSIIDAGIGFSVKESLINAIHEGAEGDKIVIFGSFYTVGEALVAIES
tara:strand:- start:310 stop:1647 length:1338 start_codon:yes stop_codon:yes gene_type:complete